MNVHDLLAKLHPSTVMQLWGDDTITNVYNVGSGLYRFESHLISHEYCITVQVTIKITAKMGGEIEILVISSFEICRTIIN